MKIIIFVIALFYSLFGQLKDNNDNSRPNAIEKCGFEEFIGNNGIPFPDITINSFNNACEIINNSYNTTECSADDLAGFIQDPQGVILVPSENNKAGKADLLLVTDRLGTLCYLDANTSHMQKVAGFNVAVFGNKEIASDRISFLTKIVSNYEGDLWIIDKTLSRVIRVRHEWDEGQHKFEELGIYRFTRNCSVVDIYMSTNKTPNKNDDLLYVLIDNPAHLEVIYPYFTGENVDTLSIAKYNDDPVPGKMVHPVLINGLYNNEAGADNQNQNIIYILDKKNRLSVLKKRPLDFLQTEKVLLVSDQNSKFVSAKTTKDGDIYLCDNGNSRIIKMNNNFEVLYTFGRQGIQSTNGDAQFIDIRDIATNGNDIYVVDRYGLSTGIQRFKNAAKILSYEISNIPDKVYNPQNCANGLKPFPAIHFKLSEPCNVKLKIFYRQYNNLDSNLTLNEIWADTLDSLSSGWHDSPITWDGLTSDGDTVLDEIVFAISTYKYFPDGDDSKLELFRLDYQPPLIDSGEIRTEILASTVKPFYLDVQLNEAAHGKMYITNLANTIIDSIADTVSSQDLVDGSNHVRFNWPLRGLDSCETFKVLAELEDLAGNKTPRINIGDITGRVFRNNSGGITNATFNIEKHVISPISEKYNMTFTRLGLSTLSNYCDVQSGITPTDMNIEIFDNSGLAGTPVFTKTITVSGPGLTDWFGTDSNNQQLPDGNYYVKITAQNHSGYAKTTLDSAGFNNVITIKTAIPDITLTGRVGNSLFNRNGKTYLHASDSNKVVADISWTPFTPSDGWVVVEYKNIESGSVVSFSDTLSVTGLDSIEIPSNSAGLVPTGIYSFSVYYIDSIGNSGSAAHSTKTIMQNGSSISNIFIDNSTPSLLIDISENIFKAASDFECFLFNNTYGFSSQNNYSYTYDLLVSSPANVIRTIKSNVAFPSDTNRISDTIPSSVFDSSGTYCVIAVLHDNFGKSSDTAYSFFYLNERPLIIGANTKNIAISGKVYITGTIGDPDITTTGQGQEFQKYTLFYKTGENQTPGALDESSLLSNGWKILHGPSMDDGLFAPIHRQDVNDTLFPYSNKSVVQTNLSGYASIAYFNAKRIADTNYTLLAFTYEKSNPLPRWGTTNITVSNGDTTDDVSISKLSLERNSQGYKVVCAATKASHLILVIAKYESGRYTKKINEFHMAEIQANQEKEIYWHLDDVYGNSVDDGTYKIIAIAEETGNIHFDYKISNEIIVNTNLSISDIVITPSSIVFPPALDSVIDESVATVQFKSNKLCSAELKIMYAGMYYTTIGPVVFDGGGAATPKTINWDGSGPGNLPYSDNGIPYNIQLIVKSLDDTNDRYDTNLSVFRYSPGYNRPDIPQAAISIVDPDTIYDGISDTTTQGTSELYWRTRLKGQKISTDSINIAGKLLAHAKQNVNVWKTGSDSNGYSIQVHKKINKLNNIHVKCQITYYYKMDQAGHLCNNIITTSKTYIDSYTVALKTNGEVYQTATSSRSYCTIRDDGSRCESCPSARELTADPTVTVLNIWSGNNTANDLSDFVEVNYSSWRHHDVHNYDAKYYLTIHFDTSKTDVIIFDTAFTNPPNTYPNHYTPLLVSTFTNDFNQSLYEAKPQIDYCYTFSKFPEKGYFELLDFPGRYLSTSSGGNKLGYRKSFDSTRVFLFTGLFESPTSWAFLDTAPDAIFSNDKFDIGLRAYCNSDTTMALHWPFPADTVPALVENGIPYDQIAYKTNDDVDPRKRDTIDGKFDQIKGLYSVPNDTMITSVQFPEIKLGFTINVMPGSSNPLTKQLIPDILNPDDYKNDSVQTIIPESLAVVWDTSAGSTPLPSGFVIAIDSTSRLLNISYNYDSLPRELWSSADDSLLVSADNGYFAGRTAFSGNGLEVISGNKPIRNTYRDLTNIAVATGSLQNASTYPFTFWRDNTGLMKRNSAITYGSGTPLSEYETDEPGFNQISLHYVDGSPNKDLELHSIDSTGQDVFTIEHNALATPKRFVEISGRITYNGIFDTSYTLNYYEVTTKRWNPHGTISKKPHCILTKTQNDTSSTLGYWDVTHCNGKYILKVELVHGDSIKTQYLTVNIGKNIHSSGNSQYVYSPYSKVQILFKPGSSQKNPVTIATIDPHEIRAIRPEIVPVGPVVEILPSGLVFTNPKPVISFNFTKKDIDSMGIPLNQLGLINIYYIDESRGELVPMESGVSRFIIHGPDTISIPTDSVHVPMDSLDIAVIQGEIEHTSIYGFFNSDGNFTINTPPQFTNVPFIRNLGGTGPVGDTVTVYVSNDSILDKTEPNYSTVVDSGGNWGFDSIALVCSGKNYIFALCVIDGKEKVLQTLIKCDTTPPILSGDFTPQYVSSITNTIYNFNIHSNENGRIIVNDLGVLGGSSFEYPLLMINSNDFVATVPIINIGKTSYRTTISLRAVDSAGNASEPKFKQIILDNEKPRIANSVIAQASLKTYNFYLHLTDNENLARFCFNIYNSKKQLIQAESCVSIFGKDTACNVLITIDSEYVEQPLISIIRIEDMAGNQTIMEQTFGAEGTEDYSQWHDSIDIPIRNLEISDAVMEFPLLIKLDGSNFQFSHVQADARDIRFAKSDGTKLPFEIELWDSIAKEAYIWVRIPNLSPNNDETIRMYWRNPSADKLTNSWRVWFDDYLAVYHITNVVQDTIADSTISDSTGLLSQYAVFATNKVKIGNNSTIFGNIGSNVLVEYGIESVIDGDITAKDSVALMDRCIVNGSVFSGGGIYQSAGITVKNDLVENAIIPNITIPRMDFNIGVIDSTVGNNQICYLSPGVYRKLSLHDNSELHLEAGTYVFDEIETGTDVRLIFDIDSAGKTEIKIKSMIGFNDRCKMVFSGDSFPSNVSIYSNQTSVLRIGPEAVISGVITAPNAEIQIYSQVKIFGALRTASVAILEPDVQIYRRTPPSVLVREIISDATAYKQHAINQKAYRENGIIAKCISLDGKKSFLECPSQIIDSSAHEFSLTMLVKAANDSFGGPLVSQFDSVAGWHFGVADSTRLFFKSSVTYSNSATIDWDTLWHYIAATYDGTKMRMYIDTLLVYENSCSINSTNTKTLIGKFLDTLYFNGIADEIRFSREALSSSYLKLSYINQLGSKNIVQIIPTKPVIALNNKNDIEIHLAVQQVGKYIDRIEFQRSNNGTVWEDIGSVTYPSPAFVDTAISCGLNYSYRARAVYGESNSEWSDTVSVVSNLCPVQVEVLSSTYTKIDFKSLPLNSNVTIERKSNNDSLWVMVTTIPARDSIYIDNGLECENKYVYRLKYTIGSLISEYMGEDTVTMKLCPPANLQAKTIDSARVLLSWNHTKDVNAHFEVQGKEHNDTIFGTSTTVPGDCISFTINSLSCETAYDFRVCFIKSNDSSEWVYLHNIQTGYCNNRPSAPESLMVESVNNNYKLTWHDNSNNEDFFIVYRSESKDPYSQDHFKIIGLVSSDTCNFIDMQFPCHMFLKYKVASANTSNGGGASAPSNIVQVHSAPCIKNGSELFPLNCVLVDNNGFPINANNAILTIRLYPDTLTNLSVCTETFTTDIINGYVNVNIGMSGDAYNIIKDDSTLYYEIVLNNVLIPERKPVLAVFSSIVNRMIKTGTLTPIGNITGEIGSLYLNITSQELYFKFGTAVSDWKKVE